MNSERRYMQLRPTNADNDCHQNRKNQIYRRFHSENHFLFLIDAAHIFWFTSALIIIL